MSGLKEYRSFWGELPRVHQIDVDPATDVEIDVSVRACWRVASNAPHHHYHRSLYDPLAGEVVETSMVSPPLDDPARGLARLRHVDFFHLHWGDWSWPMFNVADSAITVGVVVLLGASLVDVRKAPEQAPRPERRQSP